MQQGLLMRIIWFVIYLVAFIFEFVGFVMVFLQRNIPCIRYAEVGVEWYIALQLCLSVSISDLVLVILGFLLKKLYESPYNVVYNGVTAVCALIAALSIIIPLTYCGNPGQNIMLVGGVLVLIAGLAHCANAVFTFFITGKDKTFNG